ncbi:MAG: porin [Rhodospirillaceae bacterium]
MDWRTSFVRGRAVSKKGEIAFRASLLAAALSTGCASSGFAAAGDPITVTISGRMNEFFFVRDDTDDPDAPPQHQNSAGLFTYNRLTIDGRVPLGDGLTARASARFIANTRQPDTMDEVFVELSSPFGRLQLGDRQAVNAGMIESVAPQAFLHMNDEIIASVVPPRADVQMRDGLTFKRYSRNATAIIYQSPRWNTLDIAVGYYPNGDTPVSAVRRVPTKNGTETSVSSVGSLSEAVRYRVLAGYYQSDLKFSPEKISAWNAMFDVFIGPVEIGGTVLEVAPVLGLRELNWAAGAMYFEGPWRFSVDWRQAHRRRERDNSTFDKVERLTFQTSYRIGPGINLGGSLFQSFQRDTLSHVWRSRGAIFGIAVGF